MRCSGIGTAGGRQCGSIGRERSRTRSRSTTATAPASSSSWIDGRAVRIAASRSWMLSLTPRRRITLGIASPESASSVGKSVSVGDEDAVLGGRARRHLGIGCSCETDPDDVGRVVAGLGEVVGQPVLDRLVERGPHAL